MKYPGKITSQEIKIRGFSIDGHEEVWSMFTEALQRWATQHKIVLKYLDREMQSADDIVALGEVLQQDPQLRAVVEEAIAIEAESALPVAEVSE